jgi:hypothetical protein
MRMDPAAGKTVSLRVSLVMFPLIALLMVGLIRSTTAHRPINPGNAAFSLDSVVNQLPMNSPYSVMYAIYEHRREERNRRVNYGSMDEHHRFVVFRPNLEPVVMVECENGKFVESENPDEAVIRRALAHALWAPLMIRLGACRL